MKSKKTKEKKIPMKKNSLSAKIKSGLTPDKAKRRGK